MKKNTLIERILIRLRVVSTFEKTNYKESKNITTYNHMPLNSNNNDSKVDLDDKYEVNSNKKKISINSKNNFSEKHDNLSSLVKIYDSVEVNNKDDLNNIYGNDTKINSILSLDI